MDVLLQQGIIQPPHNHPCLQGDFLFPFDVAGHRVYQELQAVILFRQFFQKDFFGFVGRFLHVIDQERLEVAGHHPTGTQRIGQFRRVAFGLLERGKHFAIALADGLSQVFMNPFLFYQHMGRFNVSVNETGIVQVDLFFEADNLLRLFDAEHVTQQRKPKRLAFPFLVTSVFPFIGKLTCRILLQLVGHGC